ncbi:MAG TPA: retropepsin-like aspartic protease [Candidatus Baltobacteraceae bacterium]|nr:retropepsin-like aspartic protease [Candidatus Baltobacteraceae bacterium]
MAFATRIALLCALAFGTLGAAPASSLARLLHAMRAAAGPVWSTHFVSISRLSFNGKISLVSSESQGVAFVLRRCSGELCEGSYFDGTRLYSVDANDTALPQASAPEPYLRSLRLIASLGFLAPGFHQRGQRVDDGGTATIAGKRYRMIFVVDPQSIPMRLYVDPQTSLVRYARDINGDDTFEYLDYRHIDGFAVPFLVLHNGHVLERYDDRTPVAPPFRAPHGLVAHFSGSAKPIATDPSHVTPVFPCKLAGVAVRCLLDTGNSGISISSELAAQLGAPVVGNYTVRGLGGYATQVVRAGPLQIGNVTFGEAYYVVLNDIRSYGYDVVIGADVMASTNVAIDASAHTVLFGDTSAPGSISVPMSFENFVPVVNVRLGNVTTQLAVDTGDESNINLAYDFYAKHRNLFAITQQRLVRGVGGSSVEYLGSIPQVTVGSYTTGPQTIGTTQTLRGTAFGHLGAAFLEQFKVQLDYMAGELHLIPHR